MTVLPPSQPVIICEDSPDKHVDVVFNVVTDNSDPLSIPLKVNADDGRVCTRVYRNDRE
jgi:hypothetical protein